MAESERYMVQVRSFLLDPTCKQLVTTAIAVKRREVGHRYMSNTLATKGEWRKKDLWEVRQIETSMQYGFNQSSPPKIRKTDCPKIKSWWRYEAIGILIHYWWKCKMVQPFWKNSFINMISYKVKHILRYNSPILLGIYSNGMKT